MNNPSLMIIVYSIALILLLFLSFFFSSSDMAYGSIDMVRFDREKENNKSKRFRWAYKLESNYDKTISTILLLNDTVNAGLDSVSTLLGASIAYLVFANSNEVDILNQAETFGLISSMICLVVKIIFGEIIAKSIGKIYNFSLAKLYSPILRVFDIVLTPITYVVSGFGKIITYPVVHKINDVTILEEDLHNMVDDIEAQGSVDEKQASLLHDAIKYTTTEAYEIMTPRVNMFAIDIEDDIYEIINNPEIYHYSRIPVYEGTIDNIIGYVSTKRLILMTFKKEKIDLRSILSKPLKFPRSTEINDILKTFKKTKKHFALIIDEYGGIEGLLTMEDILEEIVGDIWDENDDPTAQIVERKDGTYIVDGMVNLEDFCDKFDIDYDEINTDYVTIGGFCIELLDDQFASIGDRIEFRNLDMKVIALDKNNSIEKLLVRVETEEDD